MQHQSNITEPSDDPASNFRITDSDNGDVTAPVGTGGILTSDLNAAAEPKKSVPTQIILLVAILAISGGLIYGMRAVGLKPGSMFAINTKTVDYDVNKSALDMEQHRKIMEDLSVDPSLTQVPLEDVQKNPFKLADAGDTPDMPVDTTPTHRRSQAEIEAERAALQRKKDIANLVESLEVHSILGGTVPVARISGHLVRQGDTIEDLVTVTEIHGRHVVLEADGKTYTIGMRQLEDQDKVFKH